MFVCKGLLPVFSEATKVKHFAYTFPGWRKSPQAVMTEFEYSFLSNLVKKEYSSTFL